MKLTRIVEHEFGDGHDRYKPDDLKYNTVRNNRELKQVMSTFDVNRNRVQDDEMIQEYESSLQELGNGSTDKGLARQSQDKSSVVNIDLTDDIQDNPKFGFDDFDVNGPNLSNQTNISTLTKDNELGKGKSIGASVNVKGSYENNGLLNVKSASMKDERSSGYNQTMKSNSQFKNEEREGVKQYKFARTKPIGADRKPCTNFESTAYDESKVVVPNTPPRKEKQTVKSRSMDYKDVQASKSTGNSVNVRQDISKVTSFYRTSYTQTQTSKPPHGNKDISKFNSLSKTKSISQHEDTRKSLGKTVYKSNNNQKVNSFYGNNDREAHVETNKSIGRPVFASKDISKFDWFGNTTRKDQQLHAKNTMRNSANASKSNPIYINSSQITNDKQAQVQTGKLKETPCFESKYISKIDILEKATHRDQHGQGMERSSQANKGNPYLNNFYTTRDKQTDLQPSKETSAYKSKDISKMNITAKTSKGQSGRALRDMDGGLGSNEDLFGSDDDLDELLVKSFTDDFDQMNCHLGTQGDSDDFKWMENDVINNDGGVKDLLGNLDNDMDDDTLVACCDDAMSPTIQVRENGPNSRLSGSSRNEMMSKGVKRKLNIPDAQSKVRRSGSSNIPNNVGISRDLDKFCKDDADERIKECPFCAKSFHSRFSKGDIDQHIALCCSSEEIVFNGKQANETIYLLPAGEDKVLAGEDKVPADEDKVLAAEAKVLPGEGKIPGGEDKVPAGEDKVPAGEDKVPGGQDKVSGGEEKVPGGEDKVPAGEDKVPGGEDKVLGGEDKVPGGEGKVAGGEGKVAGSEDKVPGGEDKVPGGEDKVPGGDDKVIAGEDKVPGGEDKVPGGEDKVLAGEDKVPGGEDKVPAGEDKVIAGEDKVPSGEDKGSCR
ncbi:choice-of-anchor A family [Paramuricea clavata]|uniref:Choice-of-anchor A family n=1 Tax=Paramuricea clavata TaxID=317549 RepID=A0A7D9IHP2_PARCT|nr:choice-of-anchor A family [Paramuricea clavata]